MAPSELPPGVEWLPPADPWPRDSLMVTFAFHCNIACQFCMVEDALNVMPGTSLAEFREATQDAKRLAGVSRIVFSGGEVTLSKELPEFAAFARSLPGIRHVRIQTNATKLADRGELQRLLDAGIDEYFVSFHAPEAGLYDRIVQREGTFPSIFAGMENIAASGATLLTNTAIVTANHTRLPEIVDRVAPLRPTSMEFWNYWPRGDDDAHRGFSPRVGDVRPHLIEALTRALSHRFPPVVKWFPRCLLGPFARYHDDGQPPALIDESYWGEEPAYACVYEGVCADAGAGCSGLSHSYIRQHGWEEDLLRPRATELRAPGANEGRVETRSLVKDAGEKRSYAAATAKWLAGFDLSPGMEIDGYRLSGTIVGRGVAMLVLQFERGDRKIEIRILPTDPRRSVLARTRSYDLIYSRVPPGAEREAAGLGHRVATAIRARDQGAGTLPG